MSREMTRTDSMPVKYHRHDEKGGYVSELHEKHGSEKQWNWMKLLGSHESSHVLFTLSTQSVLGAFLLVTFGAMFGLSSMESVKASSAFIPLLFAMVLLLAFGMFKLNMHLGKPHRFYRGFNNLRYSPVSREIAGVTLFFVSLMGYVFFSLFDAGFIAALFAFTGAVGGLLGLYFMYRIYRIKARPYWDHWQAASAFFGNMISLGALLVGVVAVLFSEVTGGLLQILAGVAFMGLALEAIGHLFHGRDLQAGSGEAAAAYYQQTTIFGKPFILRNLLLCMNLLLAAAIGFTGLDGLFGVVVGTLFTFSMLLMVVISRSLFFVLVIPTTMPGAFFWRNQEFVEHARETGMAQMEQVGVVYERHHSFKADELITTIRETSLKDMFQHLKEIVTWN